VHIGAFPLARPDIEAPNITGNIDLGNRGATRRQRGANDDHIANHNGWRTRPDLARLHHLPVQAFRQFHDAILPKHRDRDAILRIQSDELVAGRNQQYSLVILAIRPGVTSQL
jgi:hypothetical protein